MAIIDARTPGGNFDGIGELGQTLLQMQVMKEQNKLRKEQLKQAQEETEFAAQRNAAIRAEQQNAFAQLQILRQNQPQWQQLAQIDPNFGSQVDAAMLPIGNAASGPTGFVDSMARMPDLAKRGQALAQRAQQAKGYDTLIAQEQARMKSATSPEERGLAETNIARLEQLKTVVMSSENPAETSDTIIRAEGLAKGEADTLRLQVGKFELKEAKSQFEANEWAMKLLGQLRPELRGAPGVDRNAYSYATSLISARDQQEQIRRTQSHQARLDAAASQMRFAAESYKMHYNVMVGRPGPDGKPMSAGQAQAMARNAMYNDLDQFGFTSTSQQLRQSGGQAFVERYATASSMVDNYVNAWLKRRWDAAKGGTLPERFRGNVDMMSPQERAAMNEWLLKNQLKPISAEDRARLKEAVKTHLRVNINSSGERGRMSEEIIATVLNDTQIFGQIDTFNRGVKILGDMTINPALRPGAATDRAPKGASSFRADATRARLGSPPDAAPFPERGQQGQVPMGELLDGDWNVVRHRLENPNLWQRDLPSTPPTRYLPDPPTRNSEFWRRAAGSSGMMRTDSTQASPPRP